MKPIAFIPLATWMLDRLATKPHNNALSGDLLEELHAGRSASWYWRQVTSAIAISLVSRSRDYAAPLAFSACWSMIYPAWQLSIWRSPVTQSLFDRWSALDWPYSAAFTLGREILPALTFIWLGFFAYLLLRAFGAHKASGLRILGSLSLSLNVLLIATITLSVYLHSSGTDTNPLARQSVYLSPYHLALSVPLALSLLSAILTALPLQQHRTASYTT